MQGSLPTSPRLSLDTKVVELSVSNRDNLIIDVKKVKEDGKNGIHIYIPRTNKTREGLLGNRNEHDCTVLINSISDTMNIFFRCNILQYFTEIPELFS